MPASWPRCLPHRAAAPNNLLSSPRKRGPRTAEGVLENGDIFRMINIFAEKFSPTNIDKADGTPLRLYTSDKVKIDVSKRRKHDMGFWHRNIDAHEIIFCAKGALRG